MTYCFCLTLPSCGSCVSHSHCAQCMEGIGKALACKVPVQEIRTEPGKKNLIIDSPSRREVLTDLLDDMGVFASE